MPDIQTSYQTEDKRQSTATTDYSEVCSTTALTCGTLVSKLTYENSASGVMCIVK